MGRDQLLNDPEQAQRLILDGRLSGLWTAMPCIVDKVDLAAMTIEAQPAIQGTVEDETGATTPVNLPLLVDVPIVFPSAGGFALTFPIAVGDEVLVVFAARCIDAWWQSGGIQRPMEMRMHDLSDGFAIPGPKSQPNVLGVISATDVELRNAAGTAFISIGADGKIGFRSVDIKLKLVLTEIEEILFNFMTTLNGFAGGGSPVSQAMLQAPAATALTAINTLLTDIGKLLK